ncbi:MAG: hypothetical protein IT438_11245 [Phycisphaerales bacterium]|nr:hypothetical protein [Phycisphaerales bacterium]
MIPLAPLMVALAQAGRHSRGGGGSGPPPAAIAVIAVVVVAVIALAVFTARAQKRKRAAVEALLAERGFVKRAFGRKEKAEREAAFKPFEWFEGLKGGAKGLGWIADGRLDGLTVVVAQHTHMVYTGGHGGHAVVNTIAAVPVGGGWPRVRLTRNSLWTRPLGGGGGGGGKMLGPLESEAFNKRWRVACVEEGFALAVLSPRVQEFLSEGGAKGEWWAIGGGGEGGVEGAGVVCIGLAASADAAALAAMLDRLAGLVGSLPGEVREGLGVG